MDLRFRDAEPTAEERAAVDALLGEPESAWEGGARTENDLRFAAQPAEDRRDQLLPALHAVNDRVGWISEGALDYICRRLTVPPAEAYSVATFYSLLSVEPRPPRVLHVCTDLACAVRGADAVRRDVEARLGPAGTSWQPSPCLGLCERAPAALALQAGENPTATVYGNADFSDPSAFDRISPESAEEVAEGPGDAPGTLGKAPGVLAEVPGAFGKAPGVFAEVPGVFGEEPVRAAVPQAGEPG